MTERPARTCSPSKLDEMPRRRAGAKAEPHAGANEIERAGGGGSFLGFDIHGHRLEGQNAVYLASIPRCSLVKSYDRAVRLACLARARTLPRSA